MPSASARIPVTPETLERIKDFRSGLGSATYDDAINFLLDLMTEDEKSSLDLGARLRDEYRRRKALEKTEERK